MSTIPNTPATTKVNTGAAVEYARICGKLKQTKRTGWVRRQVPHVESVADHSWRVSALTLLLHSNLDPNESISDSIESEPQKPLDISKCMEMAILHDLAESIVGDIAPSDNVPKQEKQQMENEAIEKIAEVLGSVHSSKESSHQCDNRSSIGKDSLLATFHEYEERQTREAIAVKDLDLLDMIIQADEYEEQYPGLDLTEFFVGTPVDRFRNDMIRDVAEEVHRQRSDRRERRNQQA